MTSSNLLKALVLVTVVVSPYMAYRGYDHAREMWPTNITDFDVFYDAGGLVLTSERGELYDRDNRDQVSEHRSAVGNFYNLPGLAFILSPLSLMEEDVAREVFAAICVAAALGVFLVCTRTRDDAAFNVVAAAVIASFLPLYDSVYLGHPSALFALLIALVMVSLTRAEERAAGMITGLLVLKHSLLIFPLIALAYVRERAAATALVVAAVAGAAPFVLLGPAAVADYVDLLWATRGDALSFNGEVTGGASLMFNWAGFFARILSDDAPGILVWPMTLLTAGLAVVAMSRRQPTEAFLAAILATLLAVPHLLNYDWVVLLPAGIMVAARSRDQTLLLLLASLPLAVNLSMLQHWTRAGSEPTLLISTLAGMATLAYLAFGPADDLVGETEAPERRSEAQGAAGQ